MKALARKLAYIRNSDLRRLRADHAGDPSEDVARRSSQDGGFTLLEILVVVAILGMLIGLVGPVALRQLSGARVSVAHQSIERLSSVLDLYRLDVGSFPTTEQGLQALTIRPTTTSRWNGPYIKGESAPVDAWGRTYVYRSPSTRPGLEYDLCSKGPEGQGTEAARDMICNTP
jgi:general secretion pathway protein G